MKRIIVVTFILLLLPFSCRSASSSPREDSTSYTGARFAAGLALQDGAPVGTLALFTRLHPGIFNATSLLPSGEQGAALSQIFLSLYSTKSVTFYAAIGVAVDVLEHNPSYEEAITYLSTCNGLALTAKISGSLLVHGAALWTSPSPPHRNARYFLTISLPITERR